MLGHAPLSAAPLSSLAGGTEVVALLDSITAISSVNLSIIQGESNVGVDKVSSTVIVTQPSYSAASSVDTGSATVSVALGSFATLAARANITLGGLEEGSNLGSLTVSGSAGAGIRQVYATLRYPNITVEATANADTTGISTTVDVNEVLLIGLAETSITGVSSFFASPSDIDADGFVFDYTPYKDLYSRSRTVYTLSHPRDTTIHIAPENNVVSILPQDSNITVYILT